MLVAQSDPLILRAAVLNAVQEGAWAPADVVASVATDYTADRGVVVAMLWDLVADGYLRYDPSPQVTGFRPRS